MSRSHSRRPAAPPSEVSRSTRAVDAFQQLQRALRLAFACERAWNRRNASWLARATVGMGGMALSVAMAVWLFEVPLRGSLAVLVATSSLFLLVALGMGLLISIVAKNQFVAGMVAIITTFLPAFILSGFIFDIGSMPLLVQTLTRLIPARYFVAILQTVFLAGDVWAVILPNGLALAVMAVFFLGLSRRKSHKRLE